MSKWTIANNGSWRRILVPEGAVEDILRSSFGLSERDCQGLFATVETILEVEDEFKDSYATLKAKRERRKYGKLWVLAK